MDYNEKLMEVITLFKEHNDEITHPDIDYHFISVDKRNGGTGIIHAESAHSIEDAVMMLLFHIEAVRHIVEDETNKHDNDEDSVIDWAATLPTIYMLAVKDGYLDFNKGDFKSSKIVMPKFR